MVFESLNIESILPDVVRVPFELFVDVEFIESIFMVVDQFFYRRFNISIPIPHFLHTGNSLVQSLEPFVIVHMGLVEDWAP